MNDPRHFKAPFIPKERIWQEADWLAADEAALDYIATRIAPRFGVSAEVISKRLRVQKLWPPAA